MTPHRLGLLALVAMLLSGCKPPGQLVSVTPEPAGANCANGGLKIETGADSNHNGTLDAGEVTSTSYACSGTNGTNGTDGASGTAGTNGTNGTSYLTTTTVLDPGDPACLEGGVEIDSGTDTNADGTLEPSEITSTQYVCNGTPQFTVKPIDPPAGPPGAYTVQAAGGAGSTDYGGHGGKFTENFVVGTFGGHAKVFATGQADASFTVPSFGTPWLGENPYEVSTDTTVEDYATGGPSTDGELYTQASYLYTWNATSSAGVEVTGLTVDAGVTLTFDRADDNPVQVEIPRGVDNAGTITTTVLSDGVSRHELDLLTLSFQGEAGSRIDLSGAAGGNGGNLILEVAQGMLENLGDVDSSGGDGTTGGGGGTVLLEAGAGVVHTGTIEASGGAGTAGSGGPGGGVTLQVSQGQVWSSGAITAAGGDGSTAGGDGGSVALQSDGGVAEIRNESVVDVLGGSVTDSGCADSTCTGGAGGSISLSATGGLLTSNGNLTTSGGAGTAGNGGSGGSIDFSSTAGGGSDGEAVPGEDIVVSGNLVANGGDGAAGGNGGAITANSNEVHGPHSQEIIFLGYTAIHVEGADGATTGGAGGSVAIENYNPADADGIQGPTGGAINYADIFASGGTGATEGGGTGGSLTMDTDYEFGLETNGEVTLNYGDVDVSGGSGVTYGYQGSIWMYGNDRSENHGTIHAQGGTCTADSVQGFVTNVQDWIGSDAGPALNTGDFDGSGISATGSGSTGFGGAEFELHGRTSAKNTGTLTLPGGDANMTDGTGGVGGRVLIEATAGPATNLGDVDVLGGTGATPGAAGSVYVGGQDVTGNYVP